MSDPQSPATEMIICDEIPFNDDCADIIVRSRPDGVDFRVHKAFLAVASPVFKAMFVLPQGELESQQDSIGIHMRDGLHIIPFDEDKHTLGALLKLCYPAWMVVDCEPFFPTVERTLAVLTAARKYAMDGVERQVRTELVAARFIEPDPLRMFALAVKVGLYDEAKVCARHTLRMPVLGRPYIGELEEITGGEYHQLQDYHLRCGSVAHDLAMIQNVQWITEEKWVWFECCRGNSLAAISGDRRKWVAKWWADFMLEASSALKERPSGETVGIDTEIVHAAIAKASAACTTCRSRVLRDMRGFCGLFSAEVERATEAVSCVLFLKGCLVLTFNQRSK
ncbi:hypothetical protein DFH07DRAFT_792145 [Mycena maculata]|uniref:BTB domain-containing protein n=1 Tax=Mycena maculata TaxID=230809 RepID=A0AAD7KB64_9AGAR|nr:hypothetical protein DFH07DRAFT_792145 [Mycena maculata]